MMHDDVKLLLPAVALGTASNEETMLVNEHVDSCAVCEEQLMEFMETVGMMGSMSAPGPMTPPPALKNRIMAAIANEQKSARAERQPAARWQLPRFSMSWQPLAGAFGAAAVAVVAILSFQMTAQDPLVPATVPQSRELTVQAAPGAGDSIRGVDMTLKGRTVLVSDLPKAPRGQTWQLWAINGQGSPTSIGVMDESASATVPEGATTLALTREPVGGSDKPTTQPVLTVKV